nr:hypothetical protein [Tanacetum cinerariifolium]
MTTLAEHIFVAGAENHPSMLDKSMYDSWASRIRLFIKGKKDGRMMLDSIDNGPLVYPTVEENGQTRPKKYSKQGEDPIDCINKAVAFLSVVASRALAKQFTQPKRLRISTWFKEKLMLVEAQEAAEDLDAYDSDCDDISLAKVVLMENLSSCDSDVLSERIKPTLYDGSVIAKEHDVISVIDDEETLILEEESRSKMLDKQNDPISIKHKINISPIDYSKLNKIREDFGKRFVTEKELSTEQAFWLKHSNYTPDTFVKSHTPSRIEAPSKLSKVSLVNESLKKLKYQLASFDKVVKKRTTYDITAMRGVLNMQKLVF